MKATITPSECINPVTIPPSKSVSHRAIICACLAKGKSTIRNLAFSEDILATIEGMKKLGAKIKQFENYIEVDGIFDFSNLVNNEINCNESGSTLRFFIPIFSLCKERVVFKGQGRLLSRPQKIYENIFTEQGIEYNQTKEEISINGSLNSGEYILNGSISSQFITGLLFALPLLEGDSVIKINPPFESRSYINLTLQTLSDFGIEASFSDENTIQIKGNQQYKPCDYNVEGDFSQLAFFAVLGAINHDIDCLGLRHDSLQGDKAIIDILQNSGVKITPIESGYKIHKSEINGIEIDLADCPDLGPILTVLAMYAKGQTRIYNAERLRIKESDRIASMETELAKMGVDIKTTQSEIFIKGNHTYKTSEELFAHNDHRIAMSLAVAIACSNSTATIEGAECINKSYPEFFIDLKQTGIEVEIDI